MILFQFSLPVRRQTKGWRALEECLAGSPMVALVRAPAATTFHLRYSCSTGRTVRCRLITGPLPGPSLNSCEVLNPPGLRWLMYHGRS